MAKPPVGGETEASPVGLASAEAHPEERSLGRALGVEIRTLRKRNAISIGDLAAAARISTGMLSKIENAQISPSLSTVQAIARALAVPITALFAGYDRQGDVSYVSANDGVLVERRGTKAGHAYRLLGQIMGGEVVVEPYLITLAQGAQPHTAFQHAGTEFIYMLTGEVSYRHGERTFKLRSGDALLFDSGAPHGPESLDLGTATYLSIIVYPHT